MSEKLYQIISKVFNVDSSKISDFRKIFEKHGISDL